MIPREDPLHQSFGKIHKAFALRVNLFFPTSPLSPPLEKGLIEVDDRPPEQLGLIEVDDRPPKRLGLIEVDDRPPEQLGLIEDMIAPETTGLIEVDDDLPDILGMARCTSILQCGSMRKRSRVPRYQKEKEIVGFPRFPFLSLVPLKREEVW